MRAVVVRALRAGPVGLQHRPGQAALGGRLGACPSPAARPLPAGLPVQIRSEGIVCDQVGYWGRSLKELQRLRIPGRPAPGSRRQRGQGLDTLPGSFTPGCSSRTRLPESAGGGDRSPRWA
jgi:hypothetical protein